MREELIINGQHCDLSADTGITLEYVSNLLSDPGKISLSHSYTVKLPRTANNARILDLPEIPAHESTMTRRYLPVLYFRNGINLIGDNAHAYISSCTRDQYELVLVWGDIPELRSLSESKATINDLPDLPRLSWVGNSYGVYNSGALFAKYASANVPKDSEEVNILIHPCMLLTNLLQRIMNNAGVSYALSAGTLVNTVVLAAPSHKPDDVMTRDAAPKVKVGPYDAYYSQSDANYAILSGDIKIDDPLDQINFAIGPSGFILNNSKSCKVSVHFKLDITGSDIADLEGVKLRFVARNGNRWYSSVVLAELPIEREPIGYVCVGAVDIEVPNGFGGFSTVLYTDEAKRIGGYLSPYGSTGSLFDIIIPFDEIITSFQNTFPLSGNLPNIEQWDFVRNCMLIGGLVPVVAGKIVRLHQISEFFDVARANDWTSKLNWASPPVVKPTLSSSWAQRNHLEFAENPEIIRDPGFSLNIQNETLKESRNWAELDFAASLGNTAIHYKSIDNGATYEDVDIEPRFFKYNAATTSLNFTEDLYGEGLKAKYASLQAAIEKPVVLEATVRLTEIDLATLDFTRPVYLAQYGRYYHVLKVQTSKTDLCKVELLQIK